MSSSQHLTFVMVVTVQDEIGVCVQVRKSYLVWCILSVYDLNISDFRITSGMTVPSEIGTVNLTDTHEYIPLPMIGLVNDYISWVSVVVLFIPWPVRCPFFINFSVLFWRLSIFWLVIVIGLFLIKILLLVSLFICFH